jgi:hypothetical protein
MLRIQAGGEIAAGSRRHAGTGQFRGGADQLFNQTVFVTGPVMPFLVIRSILN